MISDEEFFEKIVVDNPEDMIRMRVVFDGQENGPNGETFWAKRIGPNHAKVCNIPFLADDISIDDIVRIEYVEHGLPEFVCVTERSTYKILIEYPNQSEEQAMIHYTSLRKYFRSIGLRIEGMVAGVAMIACPITLALSDCINTLNHASDLIDRYMIMALGESAEWQTLQKNSNEKPDLRPPLKIVP